MIIFQLIEVAPLHLSIETIEKGAFWSPSTKVANFTYLLNSIKMVIFIIFIFDVINYIE